MALTKKNMESEGEPPSSPNISSNEFTIHKAKRSIAKIRVSLSGISGTGKTMSALLMASGLGKKILIVDTENASADLYADITDYDVLPLNAPYTSERYVGAIKYGEEQGYDVIILDSITHEWAGEGGCLERQGVEATRTGNSYSAWHPITLSHQKFVDAIVNSKCHIIATMRSKPKCVIDTSGGKTVIRKLGLESIQKDGTNHEFTIAFDIALDHNAFVAKDRTQLFDGQTFKITKETGEKILKWLNKEA